MVAELGFVGCGGWTTADAGSIKNEYILRLGMMEDGMWVVKQLEGFYGERIILIDGYA